MTFIEEQGDVFELVDEGYTLMHCIASDYRMGAGIAVPMNKRFGIHQEIKNKFGNIALLAYPECYYLGGVLNMVTKQYSSGKPNYDSFYKSLQRAKVEVVKNNIIKVGLPRIGCGIDRLAWGTVRRLIKAVFYDTDVELRVRYL